MDNILKFVQKLEPIHGSFDSWNQDDLFNLVLEQREKINELTEAINKRNIL